jgi:hypothetical protein
MNTTASAADFQRLNPQLQGSIIELLQVCQRNCMTCRCELVGRDFIIVVGRGFSSPKYWLDMYERA